MSIITLLYNEILYQPLFNGLIFLYNIIPGHDFGVAIIVLTVAVRAILYPFSQKMIRSQKELQILQPKIKEAQQKYKHDKEKQGQALMELYKTHKVNPASGCLLFLIQLPVLIALYSVFRKGFDPQELNALYSFIANPGAVNPMFLGLIDLSQRNLFLAFLTGAAQFVQSKMMTVKQASLEGKPDFAAMMQKQMLYVFPVMIIWFAASVPAGLALYWLTITLFGIVQQYFTSSRKSSLPSNGSLGKPDWKSGASGG